MSIVQFLKILMLRILVIFLMPVVFFGLYKQMYEFIKTNPYDFVPVLLFWFINPTLFILFVEEKDISSYFPTFFVLNILITFFSALLIGAHKIRKLQQELNDPDQN